MKKTLSVVIALAMMVSMLLVPAVASADAVAATVTTGDNYQVTVAVTGTIDSYQVWGEIGGVWKLVKGYADGAEDFVYNIAEEDRNASGVYSFYVRAKNAGSVVYQEELVAAFAEENVAISALTVDGAVAGDYFSRNTLDTIAVAATTAYENAKIKLFIAGGSNADYVEVSDTGSYAWTPEQAGTYKIKAIAYDAANPANKDTKITVAYISETGNNSAKITNAAGVFSATELVAGDTLDVTMTGNFTLPEGKSASFRYGLAEPNIGGNTGAYGANAENSFAALTPGVYSASAYVTTNSLNGFDDGIIKVVTVKRNDGTYVDFTLNETAVNGTIGEAVEIVATTAGTYTGVVSYQFLKKDMNGTNLIKDWSTDNTVTFTPAKDGDYEILVRAKGADAGSYEVEKKVKIAVGEAVVNTVTLETSVASGEAGEKTAVTLTANADVEGALYKFVVNDELLGPITVKGYSPVNTVNWVPRRDGNYDIKVTAISATAGGFEEATATIADYVVTETTDVPDPVAIEDVFSDASLWRGDAIVEQTEDGLKFTKTEAGQGAYALVTADFANKPLVDFLVSSVSGAAVHIQFEDLETGEQFLVTGLTNAPTIPEDSVLYQDFGIDVWPTVTNGMLENPPGRGSAGTFRVNVPLMTIKYQTDLYYDESIDDYAGTYSDPNLFGWNTEKTFKLYIIAEAGEAGNSVTVKSATPVAWGEESIPEVTNEAPAGIWRGRDFGAGSWEGNVNFTEAGMTISGTNARVWTTLAIDCAVDPIIEFNVTGTANGSTFYVMIDDGAVTPYTDAKGDTFATSAITTDGTYRINLTNATLGRGSNVGTNEGQFTGKKTFFWQFVMASGNAEATFTISDLKIYVPTPEIGTNIANWGARDGTAAVSVGRVAGSLAISGSNGRVYNNSGVTYNTTTYPYIGVEVADFVGTGGFYLFTNVGAGDNFTPLATGGHKVTAAGKYVFDVSGIASGLTTWTELAFAFEGDTVATITNVVPLTTSTFPAYTIDLDVEKWTPAESGYASQADANLKVGTTTGSWNVTQNGIAFDLTNRPILKVVVENYKVTTEGTTLYSHVLTNYGSGDTFNQHVDANGVANGYYITGNGTYYYDLRLGTGTPVPTGEQSGYVRFGFEGQPGSFEVSSMEFLSAIPSDATPITSIALDNTADWRTSNATVEANNGIVMTVNQEVGSGEITNKTQLVNLSATPYLNVKISGLTEGAWMNFYENVNGTNVAMNMWDGSNGAVTADGTYNFAVKSSTGRVGLQNVGIGAIINGTAGVASSVTIEVMDYVAAPVFAEEETESIYAPVSLSLRDWSPAEHGYVQQSGKNLLFGSTSGSWNVTQTGVPVDITKAPYLKIVVTNYNTESTAAGGFRSHMLINYDSTGDTFNQHVDAAGNVIGYYINGNGTYYYDLRLGTQLVGEHTAYLRFGFEGDPGSFEVSEMAFVSEMEEDNSLSLDASNWVANEDGYLAQAGSNLKVGSTSGSWNVQTNNVAMNITETPYLKIVVENYETSSADNAFRSHVLINYGSGDTFNQHVNANDEILGYYINGNGTYYYKLPVGNPSAVGEQTLSYIRFGFEGVAGSFEVASMEFVSGLAAEEAGVSLDLADWTAAETAYASQTANGLTVGTSTGSWNVTQYNIPVNLSKTPFLKVVVDNYTVETEGTNLYSHVLTNYGAGDVFNQWVDKTGSPIFHYIHADGTYYYDLRLNTTLEGEQTTMIRFGFEGSAGSFEVVDIDFVSAYGE